MRLRSFSLVAVAGRRMGMGVGGEGGLSRDGRGWRWRLVAAVVDDAGKEVLAAAGHGLDGFFGGPVFATRTLLLRLLLRGLLAVLLLLMGVGRGREARGRDGRLVV